VRLRRRLLWLRGLRWAAAENILEQFFQAHGKSPGAIRSSANISPMSMSSSHNR
jgi:hypothetical protein